MIHEERVPLEDSVTLDVTVTPAPAVTTVVINGLTVDLAGVFPLKVGDWRKLEAKGVTPDDIGRMLDEGAKFPVTTAATFVQYVCSKVDTRVTQEFIDGIDVPALYTAFTDVLKVRTAGTPRPT